MTVLFVDEYLNRIEIQIYYLWNVNQHFRAPLETLPAGVQALQNLEYYYANYGVPYLQSVAVDLQAIKDTSLPDVATAVRGTASSLDTIAKTALPDIAKAIPGLTFNLDVILGTLLPAIREELRGTGTSLDALTRDLAPLLAKWNQQGTPNLALDEEVKAAFFKWLGPQEQSGPGAWFMEIVAAVARELGKLVVGGVQGAVDLLHVPMEAVVLPAVQGALDKYRAAFAMKEPLEPGDSVGLAVNAFGAAMSLGTQAHAFAQIVELLHPTKELGLAHLAAGLANAAGFGPVMNAAVGRRLDVALGRTTEMQARSQYRTVWAGVGEFVDMWLEGRITAADVRRRLEFEGWPDWQIDAYIGVGENDKAAVPYREARPTDLAYVYEDITTPDDWILRQLVQSGFHREDAQQLMVGLRRRSMRQHTSGYISELVGAFGDGLLDQAGLRAYLRGLGLREEAQDLIVNRAAMNYFRQTSKDLLAVYRDMVDKNLISITDFRTVAAALGFQDHTVAAEVARLDAKARGRLLVEEQREAEAAIREFQRLIGTEYAERVRRGLVTPESMERVLVQAGVEPAQAAAMARIAAIRQIPALKLPEALTPEAEAQKVQDILARTALERVKDGLMSQEFAVTYLVSIGVPKLEAEAEVALAYAQGFRPPKVHPPPTEAPEVREARRNRTQATVAAFQAGEFDEKVLLDRLRALGHSPSVAVSIVEQEATERRLRLERLAESERSKVLAEIQKLEETLILELVRKRQIEPEDAVAALISIGVEETQADLLVKRELLKAAPVRST